MENITITVNGQKITVPKNYTVMQAAEEMGIEVPRLCFLKDINETSACRLCVVDVKNMRGLKNSCTLAVEDGMEVRTDTDEIRDSVVANLQLLASNHVFECWACERETSCELLDLMRRYNVENVYGENPFFDRKDRMINDTSTAIVLDSGKCILCGRCVTSCEKETGLGILAFNERGNKTYVGPANFHSMADSGCIYCGKCVQACPVAAIKEKSHIDSVLEALRNPNKKVVVGVANPVHVAIGEEFGSDIGTNVEAKVYKSLEKVGFNQVMNLDFAAEVNIMENATEFIDRLKNHGNLPLISSCSASLTSYVEQYEPEYVDHLSTVKSTQQIAGLMVKHHYAEKLGYEKENVVFVTVMPCIASKYEAERDELRYQGIQDVDYVLTTREYARLIKRKGIDFMRLSDGTPYGDLAEWTKTNVKRNVEGQLVATMKTASALLEERHDSLEFKESRSIKGVLEASYRIAGMEITVAQVRGTENLQEFFRYMKKTKKQYHYVEFMIDTNGCVDGGGQPIHPAKVHDSVNIAGIRYKTLLAKETDIPARETTVLAPVSELYKEHLTSPGSKLAKEMLHTTYKEQKFYE